MTPPFRADIRRWPTVAAFRAHLAQYDPAIAGWARGIVIHDTYEPEAHEWYGRRSMDAILRYYRDVMRWDSGPHLFVSGDAPNPAHRGIWQLTALNERAIHAGMCNATRWGVEVVGRHISRPWSPATRALTVGALAALCHWRGLTPETIIRHRDCTGKACPGAAIILPDVRRWVAGAL